MKSKITRWAIVLLAVLAAPVVASEELSTSFAPASHGVWLYVYYEDQPVKNATVNVNGSLLGETFVTNDQGIAFIRSDNIIRNLPSIEIKHTTDSGKALSKTLYLPFYL